MEKPDEKLIPSALQDIIAEFAMVYLLDQPKNMPDFINEYEDYVKNNQHTQITYDLIKRKSSAGIIGTASAQSFDYRSYTIQKRKSFYDKFDENGKYVKVYHEKTDKQRQMLMDCIVGITLFSHLDAENLGEIIDAMFERKVKAGEVVIKQGDIGDNFYAIQEGIFHVYITHASEKEHKEPMSLHVNTYNNEGSFGELALLYDQPRAATVTATTDGIIWGLDRVTFKRIVYTSAMEKRKKYKNLIANAPLLNDITDYEIENLTDALVSKKFKADETIFKDCVDTDGIYFIEEGSVVVTYCRQVGGLSRSKTLQRGDAFGEYGLLQGDSQILTTVVTVTDLKVAFLDKYAFERLLGQYKFNMRNEMSSRSVVRI